MKNRAGKMALLGLLSALALCLSFLETLLPPIPLLPPGAKLGISNIVSMYAAGSLGLASALFLAVLKGAFAFFTRGVTAGMMSLSGGLLSSFLMWLLWKRTGASFLMTGICGALSHNFAQFLCALLISASGVWFYLPSLLFFGVASGTLTGLLLRLTLPPLQRLSLFFPHFSASKKPGEAASKYNKSDF